MADENIFSTRAPAQARIAALAFEVLYEKDPVEDLEELLKDKERPTLRFRLQQAIKGSNSCDGHCCLYACSLPWLDNTLTADALVVLSCLTQLRTRRVKAAPPSSA